MKNIAVRLIFSAKSELCERVFPGTAIQEDLPRSRRLHSWCLGDPPGSGNRNSEPGTSKLEHESRSRRASPEICSGLVTRLAPRSAKRKSRKVIVAEERCRWGSTEPLRAHSARRGKGRVGRKGQIFVAAKKYLRALLRTYDREPMPEKSWSLTRVGLERVPNWRSSAC